MAAWTVEQYQALCVAIAKGIRRVKYGDQEIQYASHAEMLALKKLMEAELGDAIGVTAQPMFSKLTFSRGRG